jgi:hypothetical protein
MARVVEHCVDEIRSELLARVPGQVSRRDGVLRITRGLSGIIGQPSVEVLVLIGLMTHASGNDALRAALAKGLDALAVLALLGHLSIESPS